MRSVGLVNLEERVFDVIKNDAGYKKYAAMAIVLGRSIMKNMEPSHRILFLRYEGVVESLGLMQIENAYQIGYRDGESSVGLASRAKQNAKQIF